MESYESRSTKELIGLSSESNLSNEQKDALIKALGNRLKRETQPKDGESEGAFFARKSSDFVNNYCCDEKGFAQQMCREHNTLQQSFFRLMLKTIKAFSLMADWKVDGRNEYTYEKSREIMKLLDNNDNCPFI